MANKVNEALEAENTAVESAEVKEEKGKKAKDSKKKVYNLRSSNKFLTVGSLGVQFFNGKYSTTDPEEARALLTIDDVELIEE